MHDVQSSHQYYSAAGAMRASRTTERESLRILLYNIPVGSYRVYIVISASAVTMQRALAHVRVHAIVYVMQLQQEVATAQQSLEEHLRNGLLQ
jgi:hypothetical protein